MSEAREKARALLAAAGDEWDDNGVAGTPNSLWAVANAREDYETAHADAALIAAAPGLLAALCDENDALRAENAGLVRELRGEWKRATATEAVSGALRAEVERLKAIPAALCVCVGATYSFDPGRNVIGQRAGYGITAGVGCPACRGTGIAIAEGGE